MTLAFHPLATIFPPIEGEEFNEFVENIRRHGVREKIVLWNGEVLEGRNRFRALAWLCSAGELLGRGWGHREGLHLTEAELEPDNIWFSQFNPDVDGDPLSFVLSKNLHRRHLTESQRAMVAANIANLNVGRPSANSANLQNISAAQAAEQLKVSERLVASAKVVQADAVPEIREAVARGSLAVSTAAEVAELPVERQVEILQNLPRDATGRLQADIKKALAPAIKEIRAEKLVEKRERRSEREKDLGLRLQSLPSRHFGIALEDFEWDHEPFSRETGMDRHPANHYETASDAHTPEEIVERCRERFAALADACILFKWTTNPHLAIAVKVMEMQGFRYVTNLCWDKLRNGNRNGHGYWFTGEHELVLVGVRGKVVPPATAHFRSRFEAPVGDHSEKPPNIHEIIEFHWPNVPKVEFNARRARPGWTCWGFDAPDQTDTDSNLPSNLIVAGGAAASSDPKSIHPAAVTDNANAHGSTASFAAGAAVAAAPAPSPESDPLDIPGLPCAEERMKLPKTIVRFIVRRMRSVAASRAPDVRIGKPGDDYMLRWWVIPRNRFFNIYLHHFLRSDDDRALHDHPWLNMSVLLEGRYTEHTIAAGGVNHRKEYAAGAIKMRGPRYAHRVELTHGPCWSLFITGPNVRSWGFHCPHGWRHWEEFVDSKNSGHIGRGCD